jgi:hypothetical protein
MLVYFDPWMAGCSTSLILVGLMAILTWIPTPGNDFTYTSNAVSILTFCSDFSYSGYPWS